MLEPTSVRLPKGLNRGQTITQMGYVVPDLAAAMARWTEVLGVGPFTVLPEIVIDEALYRGAPTEVEIEVATAEAGGVQIELIEQKNPVPSCYRDLFEPGHGGLHHVAVQTANYDAEVSRYQSMGFPTAFCGVYQGVRFAYMDTSPSLGIMVEVVETPAR